MRPISLRRSHPVLAAGAIAAALVGWTLWPAGRQPEPVPAPLVVMRAQGNRMMQAPTVHQERSQAAPTLDWLLGTWSERNTGGKAQSACDLPTAVTFRAGEYFSPRSMGRYALNGDRLLLWGRTDVDADAGEDRSHNAERTTRSLQRLSDTTMLRDGTALFRCNKAANNQEQDQ